MKQVYITATTLDGIEKVVSRLAKSIDAPLHLLPTYGSSEDFARPHIEIDARGYHFVVVERGEELERRMTNDPHELLYWIFNSITFSMAIDFEVKHRQAGQDSRRIGFQKQVELLAELDSIWADRAQTEHDKILQEYPFNDSKS